jgi:sugar fermentation stimulation protein A
LFLGVQKYKWVKLLAIVIQNTLIEGIFRERRNRFVGIVDIGGEHRDVHITNTGRMKELLIPGAKVLLKPAGDALRKTQYTLYMVLKDGIWVALDSIAANVLIYQALLERRLAKFYGYQSVRREVTFGRSRFDAALIGEETTCYIEVKCCTLVVKGEARFPDAPTERGRKHVEELIGAVQAGYGGALVFVAQREDAQIFHPHDETDPQFGQAVRLAHKKGVKVLAFNCHVTPLKIAIKEEIPVDLS